MKNMTKMTNLCCAVAVATLFAAGAASAATITIVNLDGAGEGFNDPTVVAALPSNPATTLGEQRLAVFQAAAARWGELLESDVEIRVQAAFNPLTCSSSGATLGSAGAIQIFRDFDGAPVAGTWYAAALANAIAGEDLSPTSNDINSQFNTSIDSGCLTGTAGWYYTTSPDDPSPSDRIPLLPVVFHEIGHGLGFQTFTSGSTGAFQSGFPDSWTHFLYDVSTGLTWTQMTSNAQRQASAINDPNLVWKGPHTTADKELYLGKTPKLIVNAPAAIAGSSDVQIPTFGGAVPPEGITGDVVAMLDDGASTIDGCENVTNAAQLVDKIALVDRGTCNFTVKVYNAQQAGAVAVLVANNAAGLPPMGGEDPLVTIPSYGILQSVGNGIRAQLAASATVNVTLGFDPDSLSGTNGPYVRMYAPNPFEQGSSVSHFTTAATPNLLMEPALNTSIFNEVDLTTSVYRDIGWTVNEMPQILIFPTHGAPEGGFED